VQHEELGRTDHGVIGHVHHRHRYDDHECLYLGPVSISALVEDLNTTVAGIQAAISIYALVMAAFILIGGKLADIVGKKRIFVIGLIIYGTGTTIASFSESLGMLIFGWSFLEGIGGALMIPNIRDHPAGRV
jgi:MFS family permease